MFRDAARPARGGGADRAPRARRRAGRAAAAGSSSASASSSESTASRCSPCEPKLRRSRVRRRSGRRRGAGPSPVAPRAMSWSRRASSSATVGAVGVVGEPCVGQAELARRVLRSPGEIRGDRLPSRFDERCAQLRDRRRSTARSLAARTGRAAPAAGRRSAGQAPRRSPGDPQAAPAGAGPSTRSKYARRDRGTALDDREPVRREDDRREPAAKRFGRRQRARRSTDAWRASRSRRRAHEPPRRAAPDHAARPRRPSRRSGSAGPSVRVRGENPCVPRWSASSRFVLPAPFSPATSTIPGERARSSDA